MAQRPRNGNNKQGTKGRKKPIVLSPFLCVNGISSFPLRARLLCWFKPWELQASTLSSAPRLMREDTLETASQERLIHRLSDEDDLRDPLLALSPRSSIILVAHIHHCMKYVLEWVAFHCKDGLDSEDRALLRRELSNRLHPRAQLSWHNFALPHDGEGIHAVVVSGGVFLPVAVRTSVFAVAPVTVIAMAAMAAMASIFRGVFLPVSVRTSVFAVAPVIAMATMASIFRGVVLPMAVRTSVFA